jgi:murein L,D-transpeptidase YcbB/YkuD
VDGVFTDNTTEEINRYQARAGLEVNGFLNSNTWPSLIEEVSPLLAGSTGRPVQALQDTLTVNGYQVEITGEYDAATQEALSRFQSDRGATEVSGMEADQQTWHLLTTQCNSSLPGHYWFDAGIKQHCKRIMHISGEINCFDHLTRMATRQHIHGHFPVSSEAPLRVCGD